MRSLRQTLILYIFAVMIGTYFGTGIILYGMVDMDLNTQFSRTLSENVVFLSSMIEQAGDEVIFDREDVNMDDFQSKDGPAYLQITRPDGSDLYKSPSLGNANLPTNLPLSSSTRITLPNGHEGLADVHEVIPRPEDEHSNSDTAVIKNDERRSRPMRFTLARDLTPVSATLARLRVMLFGLGSAAIALGALTVGTTLHRILRPLDKVANDIFRIDVDKLNTRIEAIGAPSEIKPVVDRINDLLERLNSAFERERSFSADVAHELRTPLAGLRSQLEVALLRPRAAVEYQDTANECLAITTQMQAMVENLLTLARLDAKQVEVKKSSFHVGESLRLASKSLVDGCASRGIHVEWAVDEGLTIRSDSSLLGVAMRNIFDNALTYTNDAGRVTVEARDDNGAAIIRVTNSGSQVSCDQASQIFERFWRADAARSATGVHCGLGLALVKRIISVLGGNVDVLTELGGNFQITIRIADR